MSSSSSTTVTSTTVAGSGPAVNKCNKYGEWFLLALRGVTIIALLMNLTAYIILIKIIVTSGNDTLEKAFVFLSSTGIAVMIIALVFAELQWARFIEYAYFLKWWPGRGFSACWVGINTISVTKTLSSAVAAETKADEKVMTHFCVAVGWILISVGLLLCLMSFVCVRKMIDAKADRDLEQALLDLRASTAGGVVHTTVQGASVSKGDVDASEATDKLRRELAQAEDLVQNLSTAMGLSMMVAKSKYGGKAGAQAAENFQREMARKEQQLRTGVAAAGATMADSISAAGSRASAAIDAGMGSTSNSTRSSAAAPAADPFTPSGGDGFSVNMRDNRDSQEGGGGRRGGRRAGPDDDELERMYYGGGN